MNARFLATPLLLAMLLGACEEEGSGPTVIEPPPDDTPTGPVTLMAAGNIAKCDNDRDEATAALMDTVPGWVAALGDNAFPNATSTDYTMCYHPTWGRHLSRTLGVLGNHEYDDGTGIAAYNYFGTQTGPSGLGYFSTDIGAWHVIVLNDNWSYVPIVEGSPQHQWLVADLQANTKACTLAMWHVPYFVSTNGASTAYTNRKVLWDALFAAGVDLVLNGHQHHYERLAPMNPDGGVDATNGIRSFNVGTGGEAVLAPTTIHPNSETIGTAFGVLKLTLRASDYDWQFVPIAGEMFGDSGTGTCH